jgi:hypothetical protein
MQDAEVAFESMPAENFIKCVSKKVLSFKITKEKDNTACSMAVLK